MGRKPAKGDKAQQARIDLIVALDEEYNILMAMEIRPDEKLKELADRCEEANLTIRAAQIRRELGVDIAPVK